MAEGRLNSRRAAPRYRTATTAEGEGEDEAEGQEGEGEEMRAIVENLQTKD